MDVKRIDSCQYVEWVFHSHRGIVSFRNFYLSFCTLLPENPTNLENSRNYKKIKVL